jgi:hypothetical protein
MKTINKKEFEIALATSDANKLNPLEYSVINPICANLANNKLRNPKGQSRKDLYINLKETYLSERTFDKLVYLQNWLNELNAETGYESKKATKKEMKQKRAIKLESLNNDVLKAMRSGKGLETKKVTITPKPKIEAIKESKNEKISAKIAFLKDGLKAGIITNQMILHEVKEGHISLSDAMELIG